MRKRVNGALDVVLQSDLAVWIARKWAAIGFLAFGGGSGTGAGHARVPRLTVLRFTALDIRTPMMPRRIKTPVLVLNGADDPAVPAETEPRVREGDERAEVGLAVRQLGGACISFTDPTAANAGRK